MTRLRGDPDTRPANNTYPFGRTCFAVLGVTVDAIQIPGVMTLIERWIENQRVPSHWIAVTGMHGVMEAQHSSDFKRVLNEADLVVPDGKPLVWLGRIRGHELRRRVYGPELMECFCGVTATRRYRHFFLGGAPGVADKLATVFRARFVGLEVAGTYSPSFGRITSAEEDAIIQTINASAADVLWVGLSTPKQEQWMYEHRDRLQVPVLVGVGAAFDFHAGMKKQAPRWMREHGLEWLFRLLQEPGRLWRRYIVFGSEFVFCVLLEQLGLRKF